MKNNHRYEALDGLRGICALLVCILHARILSHFYALDFIRNAYLFVDFFFVLSGFVICVSYSNKIKEKKDFLKFAIKRVGRIWPLHILMLLVLLAIELAKYSILSQSSINSDSGAFVGRFSVDAFFSNVFLIHALGIYDTLTWNNPSWSISVEFFTYLVFGLIVYLFRSKLQSVSILIAISSILVLYFLNSPNMDITYDYGLIRCFAGFFIGVFIFLWRKISLSLSFFVGSVIEWILVVLIVLFVSFFGHEQWSLLSPIVFGFTVWFFSYELGSFSSLLKSKFIQILGVLSFTMYMLHSVLLTVMWRFFFLLNKNDPGYIINTSKSNVYSSLIDLGGPYAGDFLLFTYLLIVVGLSALIYKLYEEPSRIKFNLLANRVK